MLGRNSRWLTLSGWMLAMAANGCGPTDAEAGSAVLMAAPIVVLIGGLFVQLLHFLYNRLRPLPPLRWRVTLILAACCLVGFCLSGLGPARLDQSSDCFVLALWLFGTTYLAVLFVTLRIWFFFSPRAAFEWSAVVAAALLILPALPMSFIEHSWLTVMIAVWIYGGFLGIVPGSILIILLGEIAVRTRLARRRAAALASVPPADFQI